MELTQLPQDLQERVDSGLEEVNKLTVALNGEGDCGQRHLLVSVLEQVRNAFAGVYVRIGEDEQRARREACETAEVLLNSFKKRPTVAVIVTRLEAQAAKPEK